MQSASKEIQFRLNVISHLLKCKAKGVDCDEDIRLHKTMLLAACDYNVKLAIEFLKSVCPDGLLPEELQVSLDDAMKGFK